MFKHLIIASLLVCAWLGSAYAEEDAAIHQELRGLLKQAENAINSGNYDAMLPILSKNLRITPINQEFLSSRKDVSDYFKKWFGEGGYLKKLHITFTPDALTELSDDKSWGLVWGTGEEDYILADGRSFDMKTRWTAVVVKEEDGHWRIRGMHVATNFLDNPILSAAEDSVKYFGIGGLLVGLLVGFGLARLLRRRR
ncbi:MAG TPA: nuclear transport factor 2 family protein [Mariprofundaceae bacterium]|nr:nuclear transport factor 2 family protein [Mariprofundaceae bacterium]